MSEPTANAAPMATQTRLPDVPGVAVRASGSVRAQRCSFATLGCQYGRKSKRCTMTTNEDLVTSICGPSLAFNLQVAFWFLVRINPASAYAFQELR